MAARAYSEARQRQRDMILIRSRRVSSFRGLPQSADVRMRELSRLRLAMPLPSKSASLARTCGDGTYPNHGPHRGWSKAYRRDQIMIGRGARFPETAR
jgi:hypothetical protein